MCVVSNVMDNFYDQWYPRTNPGWPYTKPVPMPEYDFNKLPQWNTPKITEAEIAELLEFIRKAKEFDKASKQPDCELQSKRDRLSKLAEELGVKISFD